MQLTYIIFLLGVSKHNSEAEVPSVIGFYRKDSQASVSADGSASRRNSELELQHHASLNEADMENRRQKRLVLRHFLLYFFANISHSWLLWENYNILSAIIGLAW